MFEVWSDDMWGPVSITSSIPLYTKPSLVSVIPICDLPSKFKPLLDKQWHEIKGKQSGQMGTAADSASGGGLIICCSSVRIWCDSAGDSCPHPQNHNGPSIPDPIDTVDKEGGNGQTWSIAERSTPTVWVPGPRAAGHE